MSKRSKEFVQKLSQLMKEYNAIIEFEADDDNVFKIAFCVDGNAEFAKTRAKWVAVDAETLKGIGKIV